MLAQAHRPEDRYRPVHRHADPVPLSNAGSRKDDAHYQGRPIASSLTAAGPPGVVEGRDVGQGVVEPPVEAHGRPGTEAGPLIAIGSRPVHGQWSTRSPPSVSGR